MRHARRTTMTTSDIDQALRVLNIEFLYGHSPHNPSTFRSALPLPQLPAAGPVYFVEDEEIDFDRVLREENHTTQRCQLDRVLSCRRRCTTDHFGESALYSKRSGRGFEIASPHFHQLFHLPVDRQQRNSSSL